MYKVEQGALTQKPRSFHQVIAKHVFLGKIPAEDAFACILKRHFPKKSRENNHEKLAQNRLT